MVKDEQKSTNLSNSIVSAIGQYSNKKTETASYDKTYVSSIIGVNRNFMSDAKIYDIDIIDAMNIPEDDKRGILNYYTFRLHNGDFADKNNLSSIYCVKSEKRYYLGQPILVCIPNNDWSRMYISPLEPENRNIFYSAEAPTLGITKGDLWLQLDDDKTKNIMAIYECVYYEDADYGKDDSTPVDTPPIYGWKLEGQNKNEKVDVPVLFVDKDDPCAEYESREKPDISAGDYFAYFESSEGFDSSGKSGKCFALYKCVGSNDDNTPTWEDQHINPGHYVSILKNLPDDPHPFPGVQYYAYSYIIVTTGSNVGKLYQGVDGDKHEWDKALTNRAYFYDYDLTEGCPAKDEDLWIQTSGSKKAKKLYRRVNGEWQFECEFGGDGGFNYIVSPEKPVVPETVNEGDCWTEYSISYNEEGKVVNTFTSLYMYDNEWIETECTTGGDVPTTGKKDDVGKLFVKCDKDDIPVAVYRCETVVDDKGKSKIQWVLIAGGEPSGGEEDSEGSEDDAPSEELNGLYSYPYPPVNDGDRWVVIDSYQNKLASAVHKFSSNEWSLEYKFGGSASYNTIISDVEPVVPESNEGDYWVEYGLSYNGYSVPSLLYARLYYYSNSWSDVPSSYGISPPSDASEGELFIYVSNGMPSSVLRYEDRGGGYHWYSVASSSGWTSASLYTRNYPPINPNGGDRWIKVNNLYEKEARANYTYTDGKWVFNYKYSRNGEVFATSENPLNNSRYNVQEGDYWVEVGSTGVLRGFSIARLNSSGELYFARIFHTIPISLQIANAVLVQSSDFVGDDYTDD